MQTQQHFTVTTEAAHFQPKEMCLQCPIIQPPHDDHPASSVHIPRQLLVCLIDTLGPREVISKCKSYLRQKDIIWKDRDIALRKLDEEKLAIKAELD